MDIYGADLKQQLSAPKHVIAKLWWEMERARGMMPPQE